MATLRRNVATVENYQSPAEKFIALVMLVSVTSMDKVALTTPGNNNILTKIKQVKNPALSTSQLKQVCSPNRPALQGLKVAV
jgi:hypothetical protein